MFHKESSIQGGGSGGGGGNKKGSKAMDVPLGKKERKQLRQRAHDFFSRRSSSSGGSSTSTITLAEKLSPLLDEVLLHHGNIMVRTLPYSNKAWAMNLYLKTPNNKGETSSPSSSQLWPYETSTQFIWMALVEKKKNVVHETPTVAFWAVLLNYLMLPPSLDGTKSTENKNNDNSAAMKAMELLNPYRVLVPCQVSKYVCRGADLMRAGVIRSFTQFTTPSESSCNNNNNNNNKNNNDSDGVMVAISIHPGNHQPFAVGLLKRPKEPFGANTKGVGVEIWNAYGDDLWRFSHTKEQISNPAPTADNLSLFNQLGGAPFDNGHYGNVGFLEGKLVVPIIEKGDGENDSSESQEEEEKEEQVPQVPKTAWDEPGDENKAETSASDENPLEATATIATTGKNDEEDDPAEVTSDEQEGDDSKTTNDASEGDNEQKNQEQNNNDDQDGEARPEERSPEDILHAAVCQGLVSVSPNKDLPMPLATFYSQYVLPNRPPGTTIDLKATKYKKFGNYVKEQISNGLLEAGPDKSNPKNTDPLALLTGFRKNHADLRGYSKANSAAAADGAANSGGNKKTKLVLVNLYVIPSHWPDLLRLDRDDVDATNATSEERKGTGMLTAPEVRKILEAYIAREELIPPKRPDLVTLDGPLTKILYKNGGSETPTEISRKDLNNLFMSKLQSAYALVEMPGSKITTLKKGLPPKVDIEVSMRQSKKFVTRIRGLEDYGIDPTYFSKDVAKRLACSATIEDDPVGRAALKKGRVELVFQGNIVDELEALLTGDESISSHGGVKASEYSIPKNVLEINLRKGVPARKRGGGSGGKKRK